MDATKAVNALTSGDFVALVDSLDTDERHDIPLPGDRLGVMARIGSTLVGISPTGELSVRPHETVEEASTCLRDSVEQIQQLLSLRAMMVDFMAERQGIDVPDDLSGLDEIL